MDSNCVLLLADMFLYIYEAQFIEKGKIKTLLLPPVPHFHISTAFLSITNDQYLHRHLPLPM
jgi:hypothetical protein